MEFVDESGIIKDGSNELSKLQEAIFQLQEELGKERSRRVAVEEECDLLAMENNILRSKVEAMTERNVRQNLARGVEPIQPQSASSIEDVEVFIEGDGRFAQRKHLRIDNASGGKNVLCVAFLTSLQSNLALVLCGGVDGYVNGYCCRTGERKVQFNAGSPILSIDVHDTLIACSMMDGSHAIAKYQYHPIKTNMQHDEVNLDSSTQRFKDHSKYVVAAKWSPCGNFLATASHDKSVNIYSKREDVQGEFKMDKVKTVNFTVTPECLVFNNYYIKSPDSLPSAVAPCELVIGLRDSLHLLCIDCRTFSERRVTLNENEWDTHISITPLYMAVAPGGSGLLLVATDKHMHVIVSLRTLRRVRVLAGHASGAYGKPTACWDSTGKYVYSNSEEESTVYVYSIAGEKVAHRLSGEHLAIVRGVAARAIPAACVTDNATQQESSVEMVATASYDKSVVLWVAA